MLKRRRENRPDEAFQALHARRHSGLKPTPTDVRASVDISERQHPLDDPNSRHFATDHLRGNLKSRTISSGFVTVGSQAIQFFLMVGSTMVLARLLDPNDFGLVAMVATIMGFARIFNDAGLSTVTIQREGITHAQVSNLFWVNVSVGSATTLALAACSPLIAWFYREPRLVSLTLALSITFLLASSSVQHLALLKRQMRFPMIAVIEITSVLAGIVTGITLASRGFSYWSLVGMQLVTSATSFGMTWYSSHWRPQFFHRHSGTRSLLHFGANLTASSLLWSLAKGSDGLLIGRVHGSEALGLYSRASALLARPVQQLIGPIESVFVPMLSRLQAEPERYRRVVLQIFEVIAVGSFLFTGLLFAIAHPLTLVVLGEKWEAAAPIFSALALVAFTIPVSGVATWLLTSQGRGREFLVMSCTGSLLLVCAFVAGLPYGPVGVAAAQSIVYVVIFLPLVYYIAGRRGPVKTLDFWTILLRHLPLWLVVCGATYAVRTHTETLRPLPQLIVSTLSGLLAGTAFIAAYPPARRVALTLLQMILGRLKARRS